MIPPFGVGVEWTCYSVYSRCQVSVFRFQEEPLVLKSEIHVLLKPDTRNLKPVGHRPNRFRWEQKLDATSL